MRYLLIIIVLLTTAGYSMEAGGKAPDFTLSDPTGKRVSLKELTAKGPVLIDFWATWCKPCLQALKHIEQVNLDFSPKGLQVIGISVDNSRSQKKVLPFIKGSNYTFTVLFDPDMSVRRSFGGTEVPMTLLLDTNGEIVYKHLGYLPGDENAIRAAVEQFFAPVSDTLAPHTVPENHQ